MKKTYTSFEEINHDLETLKLKKEIHYHKIFRAVDNVKRELAPDRVVKNTFGSISSYVKGSSGIRAFIVTALLKYFLKKKNK